MSERSDRALGKIAPSRLKLGRQQGHRHQGKFIKCLSHNYKTNSKLTDRL